MPEDAPRIPDPVERRGLLIAADGLDGSGKTATLEALGRWFERKGRRVRTRTWDPSTRVSRAAASSRGRRTLSPRVAALLSAADAAQRFEREFRGPLARGDIILCDRYAWTAIAREVARGVDAAWIAAVYRFAPRPDLVLLHQQAPSIALARALATRPETVRAEAIAADFGDFLDRMADAFTHLAGAAEVGLGGRSRIDPWTVPVVSLDARLSSIERETLARDAVRALLGDPTSVAS